MKECSPVGGTVLETCRDFRWVLVTRLSLKEEQVETWFPSVSWRRRCTFPLPSCSSPLPPETTPLLVPPTKALLSGTKLEVQAPSHQSLGVLNCTIAISQCPMGPLQHVADPFLTSGCTKLTKMLNASQRLRVNATKPGCWNIGQKSDEK